MATSPEIKQAVAAYRAIEAEKCPYESSDTLQSAFDETSPRSIWFKDHWEREKAAKDEMDKRLAENLALRGVRIKTDGCGCCDSPRLTVFLDDEFICDEGNWYFDNTEGREVPK